MTSFKFKGVTKTALLTGAIAVLIPLAACASKNDDIDLTKYVETIDPADKLYNEGLANLDAGRLDEAAKKFAAVDRQHPYTEWARKSLVMAAFTNYRKGNYEEAISMAKRYNTLYPTSPESAYAYYIIGLSYFRQIPDVTRDQAASRRAIAAMQEVVDRFPDSEYTDDAKAKIRFARDHLERKEYLAAIKRFRGVVEEYSNTRQVEEALARLVEAYYALGLTSEAQMAASVLGKNFPDSQWYKDSYKLLQSGGLQPRENGNSWLAKASALITGGGS